MINTVETLCNLKTNENEVKNIFPQVEKILNIIIFDLQISSNELK